MPASTTHFRICPICEATCGLAIEVSQAERSVLSIRGDAEDVFSAGYLCPKGVALRDLDTDPDRLRAPLVKRGGRHVPVSWDEAFDEIQRGLRPLLDAHGNDALGIYLGNPVAHNASHLLYTQALLGVFKTHNFFSASTLDQLPKQVASGLMFGDGLSVAIPDIDHTQFLLILGGNPMVSNGSLFTVPDFRHRVRRMQQRGGQLVVVDPRRSETAAIADQHLAIRPGSDALLLAALAQVIFAEGRVSLGAIAAHSIGLEQAEAALAAFTPERVAHHTGLPADAIRRLAHALCDAESAAVYGRIGTTTTEFGTTASWLVDLLNAITGNLDRRGGAMFPKAPAFAANTRGTGGSGRGIGLHRHRSRVRGAPEALGELPAACMAEEIETPGDGQIRAMLTVAGNPAVSSPNAARLSKALASLDFMVSLDLYLNETTRHANVILPGLSPLEDSHFDIVFPQFSVRNWARYSPPIFPVPEGRPTEWEILLRLAGILLGQGPKADIEGLDALAIQLQVQGATKAKGSTVEGRDAGELLAALSHRRGPERLIDFALRSGPYGDHFGVRPEGLTLAKLEATPHGIDLGALEPRIPELLRTPSGKVELAPELLIEDVGRLASLLDSKPADGLRLVGRRHVRSNNSWMHNLPSLARGAERCTLQINPTDAASRGIEAGGRARVSARVGTLIAQVEVTDVVREGVVSLPHGWGHDEEGSRMGVAAERPGVNSNLLADEMVLDPISGTAALNGIPVEVEAVA